MVRILSCCQVPDVHRSQPLAPSPGYQSYRRPSIQGRRRSSLFPDFKAAHKPRVRLVSANQSFEIHDENVTEDLVSNKSYHSRSDVFLPAITVTEPEPDYPPPRYQQQDSGDCYANQTVKGSHGNRLSKTLLDVAKRGRLFSKRKRARLVQKNGNFNIVLTNFGKQNYGFFMDYFTTALDMPWKWLMLIFCFAFIFSWVGFAGIL